MSRSGEGVSWIPQTAPADRGKYIFVRYAFVKPMRLEVYGPDEPKHAVLFGVGDHVMIREPRIHLCISPDCRYGMIPMDGERWIVDYPDEIDDALVRETSN